MVEFKSIKELPYNKCIKDFDNNHKLRFNCLNAYLKPKHNIKHWSKEAKAAFYFEFGVTCQILAFFNEGINSLLKSLDLFMRLERKSNEHFYDVARLRYFITMNYIELGEFSNARRHSNIALELFQNQKNKEGISLVYDSQSLFEQYQYNFDISLKLAFNSLDLRKQIQKLKYLIIILGNYFVLRVNIGTPWNIMKKLESCTSMIQIS